MTEAGRLTAVLDVDDSKLTAGLSKARQTASTAIAGIEQDANRSLSGAFAGVGGGLQHSLSKGSFRDVGKTLGADLVQGITAPLGSMGTTAASIATAMGPVGIAAVAGTAAIVGLGAASARAAMDWQSMSTSIGRTTGLEGTNLSNLMNSLQELRMQMGLSREGAAAMAEAAGSLGVGERWMTKFEKTGDASALNQYKKEIVDYVSVIGKVSTAWGMSNETASQSIGAMASVTLSTWNKQREGAGEQAITWDEYAKKVGGSIDLLGNKMGSSEQGIVTAMTHIGSSVADLAPSEETYAKWTGLASFMVEKMPQSADTAGEAIKDAMTYIQRDQEGAVSGLLGIDQPTLIKKMKTDAVGTIQEIGKAVASMPEAERSKLLSGSTFGQTGGQLIKQVVADELSGTGRLDYAIDVSVEGFDHSKIDQGFESVMGDATQQANRVVQVFQVGLEKIGTVTLPAITGGLKAIADTGEWMVEKGSDAWGFASQRNEDANKAFVEGGLVEGFKTLFFGPDQTAQVAEGVAEGTEEGMQKGAEAAAPAMSEAVGNALQGEMEKAYKDLIAKGISKEIASAMAYGGATTDAEALAIINGSQSGSWKQALSSQFARSLGGLPGLDPYQISEWTYKSSNKSKLLATTASGDLIDSFNSSKGLITEDAYDAWVKGIQPGILDTNLYFQAHTPEIRDAIAQAWKDGAISGTEKENLVGLKQSLEDLKVKFSGEFDRAGLQRELDQATDLVSGKKIELEVDLKAVWEDWSSEQYKAQYRFFVDLKART